MSAIRHYLKILGQLLVDDGKQIAGWGDRSRHRLHASGHDDLMS
jgi:hypothetical protein